MVDRSLFIAVSPFLASLALLLILFDAGLNMEFYQMIRGAPRGMLLVVVGVLLEITAITVVAHYYRELRYLCYMGTQFAI